MDPRVWILALPSLLVLSLLVVHSLRTLPRARALAFWGAVASYGILRGAALHVVIGRVPGASFPYAIRDPLFPVFGVPLQEIAGWAIVCYIGWWLGCRVSRYLFTQVAWACLFLGAVSWTVESAAVAAGWWRWSVPVDVPLLLNVPLIAVVDWAFVGIDFLLPFVVVLAPELRGHPARWLALLAFPVHFASHLVAGSTLPGTAIPLHHLAHWTLAGLVVWLALRAPMRDDPFARGGDWLPVAGLSVIVLDAAAVDVLIGRRPELLRSLVPTIAIALLSLLPATASLLDRARRPRWVSLLAMALLAVTALGVHAGSARGRQELTRRLDGAIAARDRGDLDTARRELEALCAEFPGSHVPETLLGEIDYRTDRLAESRAHFLRAVEIKQDDARGHRFLAVIELRMGRAESAAHFAQRGLAIAPLDPELRYLSARALEAPLPFEPAEPDTLRTLAALAYEVGDTGGARRFVASWRRQRPDDLEARRLAALLGD